MEEDTKILEELINEYKDYFCGNYNIINDMGLKLAHIEAIENLIKRNKELQEALKDEIQCFNKMKDIAETLRKENVEYIIQNRQYELNYIPKSKVREKIEELEKGNKNTFIRGEKILVLQELLQEGDK